LYGHFLLVVPVVFVETSTDVFVEVVFVATDGVVVFVATDGVVVFFLFFIFLHLFLLLTSHN